MGVHSFNLLAVLLSLPLVLLIWSTVTFAASIVMFAWRGVDPNILAAGGGSGTAQFGMPTAWVTTGVFIGLVVAVLSSIVFFWRVTLSWNLFLQSLTIVFQVWTPPRDSDKFKYQ